MSYTPTELNTTELTELFRPYVEGLQSGEIAKPQVPFGYQHTHPTDACYTYDTFALGADAQFYLYLMEYHGLERVELVTIMSHAEKLSEVDGDPQYDAAGQPLMGDEFHVLRLVFPRAAPAFADCLEVSLPHPSLDGATKLQDQVSLVSTIGDALRLNNARADQATPNVVVGAQSTNFINSLVEVYRHVFEQTPGDVPMKPSQELQAIFALYGRTLPSRDGHHKADF